MTEPLRSTTEEDLLRRIRVLESRIGKTLEARRKRAAGALPTEEAAPYEGSFARLAGKAFLDAPRALAETAALIGTAATVSGIGAPGPIASAKLAAEGLPMGLKAAEAVGKASERIPGIGGVSKAAREGLREEEAAILGRPGAGLGTKAAVLGTEVVADPFELLPGGLAIKGVRLAVTGAGLATLGAVATSKAARQGAKKVAGKLALEGLEEAASEGVELGARQAARGQTLKQGRELSRASRLQKKAQEGVAATRSEQVASVQKRIEAAAEKAQAKAAEATREAIREAEALHVKQVADHARAVAAQLADFPQAPVRTPPQLRGQEKALEAALSLARAERKFAPVLQTSGPGAGLRSKFHQRAGSAPTARPLDQIQSQLARDPATGVSVGGGLPKSFGVGRVEAAVVPRPKPVALLPESAGPSRFAERVPFSDAKPSPALKQLTRELSEGPADIALRAEEVQKAAKAGQFDGKILPDGDPLAETMDEATGKIIHPRRFQERLAATWHSDYALLKDKAIRRAEQRRVLIDDVAKTPEAKATYAQLSKRTGRSVGELIDGDLLGLVERTGNPMIFKGDSLEAAKARIEATPVGDQLMAEVDLHRKIGDRLLRDANDLNAKIGQQPIDYRENWIYHKWKSPSKLFGGKAAKAKAKGPSEFRRDWPTYRDGVANGAIPNSLRFSDNSLHGEMQYARSLASKQVLELLARINTTPGGSDSFRVARKASDLPADYKIIENHELARALGASPGSSVGVHKDISRVIEGLLTEQSFNGLDKVLAWSKLNNLGISTFHHFVLGLESAPAILGPVRGVRAAAKLGMGLPGISPRLRNNEDLVRLGEMIQAEQAAGRVTGLPAIASATEMGREAMVRSLRFAVTGEPSSDILRTPWEEFSRDLVKIARKAPVVGKHAGDLMEIGIAAQAAINRGLWDGLHTPVKHFAFNVLYDSMLQVKRGNWDFRHPFRGLQGKMLKDLSDEEIGYRVARVVNDEFGGQLWEGHVRGLTKHISSPEATKWLRRFMLSPDWLTSSVRMGLAAFDWRDPVRVISGFRHWKNFALGTALYANLTNFVLSKALRGEGYFIFNDPERRSLFHINTGFRDRKTGERLYARWGKQFQEVDPVFKLASGQGGNEAMEVARRKITPLIGAVINLVNPPEDFPTPLQIAQRKAAAEGRELSTHEWGLWAMTTLAKEGVTPFSFRDTGFPLSPVAISKGINVADAQDDLTDAIDDGDSEEVQRILGALHTSENLRPEVVQQILGRARRAVARRRGLIPEETEDERIIRRRNPR